jgi:hypothetical protein
MLASTVTYEITWEKLPDGFVFDHDGTGLGLCAFNFSALGRGQT